MSSANEKQVGGDHYKGHSKEHWDLVHEYDWDYFQAQIIKYVMRHKDKNNLQDLQKAQHFLEKYIELIYPHGGIVPQGEEDAHEHNSRVLSERVGDCTKEYVNQ